MPTPGGVDELNMNGDIVPLHRDTLELRWRWRELYPGANRYRNTL